MKTLMERANIGTTKLISAGRSMQEGAGRTRLSNGKRSSIQHVFRQPLYACGDLESVWMMEERYGIKEEGLF